MAEIQLKKGVLLIDDSHLAKIKDAGFRIYDDGRGYPNLVISLHRYVKGAPPPGMVIDHINRNTYDARSENLRFLTQRENVLNTGPLKGTYKGVYYNSGKKKGWHMSISWKGNIVKKKCRTEIIAAKTYDAAISILAQSDAPYLNFPNEPFIELEPAFLEKLERVRLMEKTYRRIEKGIYLLGNGKYRVSVAGAYQGSIGASSTVRPRFPKQTATVNTLEEARTTRARLELQKEEYTREKRLAELA